MNDQPLYGILKHHPNRQPATGATTAKGSVPSKGNEKQILLAGYMAHEFRTKGTVLGHKLDGDGDVDRTVEMRTGGEERYKEITSLIMMKNEGGGVFIPGVVNPTQLARWIQM